MLTSKMISHSTTEDKGAGEQKYVSAIYSLLLLFIYIEWQGLIPKPRSSRPSPSSLKGKHVSTQAVGTEGSSKHYLLLCHSESLSVVYITLQIKLARHRLRLSQRTGSTAHLTWKPRTMRTPMPAGLKTLAQAFMLTCQYSGSESHHNIG